MAERVLIVDDDPVQRRLLQNIVEKAGYQVATADGGEAAIGLITAPDGPHFECVVLDLVMPDLDGLGVLGRMREAGMAIPVIVQTAHGGIDVVVSAMRAGAIDFAVKPIGAERLLVSLRNAMATRALEGELARMKRSRGGILSFKDIITRSAKMRAVLQAAQKSAGSAIPVLVEGESGVGKELIARAIHGSGARRGRPFVAVNCGALPENLIESILFGHEKGAFTGATERHEGKFQEASGGTLFLDEVGELPPPAQVKLLRALQEGEVEPVGGKRPVQVNVRVISATNRDLSADVKSGRFREDLFYRLHVFPILVPPLREHAEDIPDLTRHFMVRFAAEEGKRVRAMSAEALHLLSAYSWPGNVRQLENAIFRAVVLAEGEEIGLDEFPQIANPRRVHAHGGGAARRLSRRSRSVTTARPGTCTRTCTRNRDRRRRRDFAGRRRCLATGAPRQPRRRDRACPAARRGRGGHHTVCVDALPQPDVGGGAAAADRKVDALPQARRIGPGDRGRGGFLSGFGVTVGRIRGRPH